MQIEQEAWRAEIQAVFAFFTTAFCERGKWEID